METQHNRARVLREVDAGQAGSKRLGGRRGGAFGTRRRGHEASMGNAEELV